MFSVSAARMGVAAMSDGTKDSQVLSKMLGKYGFKLIAVQARCAENLLYTSWEPNLQYRFPKETYTALVSSLQTYRYMGMVLIPGFLSCTLFIMMLFPDCRGRGSMLSPDPLALSSFKNLRIKLFPFSIFSRGRYQ